MKHFSRFFVSLALLLPWLLPGAARAADTDLQPGEEAVAPDLAPYPMEDVRLDTVNGRTVLRFSSTFMNRGNGIFDLVAGAIEADGYQETYQRLIRPDGTERRKEVGNFMWHEAHHHYHYSDFADYVFAPVRLLSPGAVAPPATIQKTTFCLYDVVAANLSLPNAAKTRAFTTCGRYRQGVSVGWADQYRYTLPDQYIDVNDMPAGVYRLDFSVDPRKRFVELNPNNDVSSVLVDLNVPIGRAVVIASAAAFPTRENKLPGGLLVRGEGDSRVFVIRNGKKRWIKDEEVFRSYGYAFADVYVLSAAIVNAIPNDGMIRLAGTGAIFAVNDQGFKRHVLTPDAFASYGLAPGDVAEVNATEFSHYADTDLIRRAADQSVFRLSTKAYVGEAGTLSNEDRASVHALTDRDFESYLTRTLATGLNVPWAIAFLPGGDMLVTERTGQLRRIGAHNAVIAIPSVQHVGEGGLMGIALHPDFATNGLVYLYFTTTERMNRIERFRLAGDTLVSDKVILEGVASSLYHDGGQIAFGPDGMLYATTGDSQRPALAQDLASLNGKTLRLTPDGGVPSDNPFGTPVWSYGHRNAQGLAWDGLGRLWETEHGPTGGVEALCCRDELNLVRPGANYGWPTIKGDQAGAGMVTPILNSGATDTWAPSGLAFTNGKLFFAGLRGSALYEATPNADGTASGFKTRFKNQFGRLRAVVVGPDGFLYLTTSNRDDRGTPKAGDDRVIVVYPDFFRAYE